MILIAAALLALITAGVVILYLERTRTATTPEPATQAALASTADTVSPPRFRGDGLQVPDLRLLHGLRRVSGKARRHRERR